MRKPLLTLAAAAVASLPLTMPARAADPVNLTIASFGQQSSWYAYAVGLAEILREVLPAGSTVDTPPDGGGTKNPLLVAAGKADLAFGMASVSKWAADGKVAYEKPMKNLRAIVGGFDQYYLGIAVNEPGVTASLDDYATKINPELDVILLGKGSAGGAGGAQMLELAGASPEEIEKRGGSWDYVGSFSVVQSQFSAGKADLWIQTVTAGHPAMTELALTNKLSFVAPSETVLGKMQEDYGWVPATLPKGTFQGQDRDLKLPGTMTNLFVRADMPEELAYTVTKALCENVEKFKTYHKALKDFSCREGAKREATILPLHPGAERYYKEKGWL